MDAETQEWQELVARAQGVIQEAIQSLPPELRARAMAIPCLLEAWPPDDADAGTLGMCEGFEPDSVAESNGPIILFLGSIQEYVEEEGLSFEDEVRTTYLHEFGHFLGLDEDELEERGLL
jgi:predicted Zn-dependent protease with MMP-like domain